MKEYIVYAINSSPEIAINAAWLRDKLLECLDVLYRRDFNVSAVTCENHQYNVSTFTFF